MEITLKIDDFEGPLDLLLHLIKEKKMDLLNLKLEVIIDEYLDFIEKMEKMNLNIASSYLVMASELIEMKSKLLLPRNDVEVEDEEENSKESLINRLLEYQRYKELTSSFRELEEERKEIYTRLPSDLSEYKDNTIVSNSTVTLEDLLKAFEKFLERKKLERPLSTKVTKKEISVEEREVSIRSILKIKKKVDFFSLFEKVTKEYVVVTFLAVLEMAKRNEITLVQQDKFEGLLFAAGDEGMTLDDIERILEVDSEEAKNLLVNLKKRYESDKHGIQIGFLGNSFKLTTKKEHKEYYQKLIESPGSNTLTQAALETLIIVAYNEPVTVSVVDEIRGVGSRDMIRRLVAKGFLKEIGKSDLPGRPTVYGTTREFLDYFGLASKNDLPKLEDVKDEVVQDGDLYHSKYSESGE